MRFTDSSNDITPDDLTLLLGDPVELSSKHTRKKKPTMSENSYDFVPEKVSRRMARQEFAGKIVNTVQNALVPKVSESSDTDLKSRIVHGSKSIGSIIVGEGVSYVLKDTLPAVLKWMYRRVTTTLVVSGDVSGKEQKRVYAEIIAFLKEFPSWKKLTTMAKYNLGGNDGAFTRYGLSLPASGRMFITYENRNIMVCFDSSDRDRHYWTNTGVTDIVPQITFTILGKDVGFMERFEDYFYELVEKKFDQRSRNKQTDHVLIVRTFDKEGVNNDHAFLPGRPVESLAITDEVRRSVFDAAHKWEDDKEFYEENFIPHKFVIVLEGAPGTGKTSIAKALATELGRTLCIASFAELSNKHMTAFMRNAFTYGLCDQGKGPVVLFEDFDDDEVIRSREAGGKRAVDMTTTVERTEKGLIKDAPLNSTKVQTSEKRSLSGVLNVFDGPIPLNDMIIILTTNTIHDIDEAILRHGRVDKVVRIGALTTPEVKRYLNNRMPDLVFPENFECRNPIKGCDLQQLLINYHKDKDKLIAELIRHTA